MHYLSSSERAPFFLSLNSFSKCCPCGGPKVSLLSDIDQHARRWSDINIIRERRTGDGHRVNVGPLYASANRHKSTASSQTPSFRHSGARTRTCFALISLWAACRNRANKKRLENLSFLPCLLLFFSCVCNGRPVLGLFTLKKLLPSISLQCLQYLHEETRCRPVMIYGKYLSNKHFAVRRQLYSSINFIIIIIIVYKPKQPPTVSMTKFTLE